MSTLVVYNSSTGYTKKYAEWISDELGCESVNIKKVSQQNFNKYETIIYGGWIMGNMIMGLNKIVKLNPKKLVVFAVGASKTDDENTNNIINQNNLKDNPFFYMEGGMDISKVGFFKKIMLKFVKNSVSKKENKTQQDINMLKMLAQPSDNSDKKFILPLIGYVRCE